MWLGFAIGCTGMAQRTAFGVLYPSMVTADRWSVGEVTGAFATAMLVYSPAVVLAGVLVDRLGVKATLLVGTLLLAGGSIGIGLAREIWQVYVLYAVTGGLGTAAVGYVPMVKLLALRAGPRLGLAIGLFNGGQGVGALLSSPTLQFIVDRAGWRPGYLLLGCVAALVLVPLIVRGAPGREENRIPSRGESSGVSIREWRRPIFWLIFLANSALGYLLLLPAHHVAHLMLAGLPGLFAATAGGLMGAFIGVGALLGGWGSDRWGPARLSLPAATLLIIGVLALISSGPSAPWLAGFYVVGGGVGRGILGVNVTTIQARAFAGPSLGRMTGILELGLGVGAFAGPYLTAVARDSTGSYSLGLSSAVAAALLVAAATLASRKSAERDGQL